MILRSLIAALVLVALTLSSFGHRTLSPADEAQADAYILAGGDWASLCGESGDPLSTTAKCMACVIAHNCALPTPVLAARPLSPGEANVWPLAADRPLVSAHTPAHPARAPPFV